MNTKCSKYLSSPSVWPLPTSSSPGWALFRKTDFVMTCTVGLCKLSLTHIVWPDRISYVNSLGPTQPKGTAFLPFLQIAEDIRAVGQWLILEAVLGQPSSQFSSWHFAVIPPAWCSLPCSAHAKCSLLWSKKEKGWDQVLCSFYFKTEWGDERSFKDSMGRTKPDALCSESYRSSLLLGISLTPYPLPLYPLCYPRQLPCACDFTLCPHYPCPQTQM